MCNCSNSCSSSSSGCSCQGEIQNLQNQIDNIVVGSVTQGSGIGVSSGIVSLGGTITQDTVLASTSGNKLELASSSITENVTLTINPATTDVFKLSYTGTLGHQYTQASYGHRFIYNTASPSRFRIEDVSIGAGGDFPAHNSLFIVEDTLYSRGVEYAGDYEANFVARSLVTKRYVDSISNTSFSNGLTKTGSVVRLGGTQTTDIFIEGTGGHNFYILEKNVGNTLNSSIFLNLNNVVLESGNPSGSARSYFQLNSTTDTLWYVQNASSQGMRIYMSVAGGMVITDDILNKGLSYAANYSASNSSNPRWIVDKAYVDGLLATASLQSVTTIGATTTNSITIDKLSSPSTAFIISNTNGTTAIQFNGTAGASKGSLVPQTLGLELLSSATQTLTLTGASGLNLRTTTANSVSIAPNNISQFVVQSSGAVNVITTPSTAGATDDFITRDTGSGELKRLPATNVYFSTASHVMVRSESDLPAAVAGVRTLVANTTYHILGAINIGSDRLSCPNNVAIIGSSPLVASITSTVSGQPLITSTGSFECTGISLINSSGTLFNCDASSNPSSTFFSHRVQVIGQSIGTIGNYAFIVQINSVYVNLTGGLTITGSNGAYIGDTVSFTTTSAITIISVPASTTFSARMRIIYSTFSVGTGGTALNVNSSATIPPQSFLLDTVTFTGAGTYLGGLTGTDNKSFFVGCVGVNNSRATSGYYYTNNATPTVIGVINTYVKALGTTINFPVTERFDNSTSNKSIYTSSINRAFQITVSASMTAGNGHTLRLAIFKNGVLVGDSESRLTTTAVGAAENVYTQTLVSAVTNDYFEIYVRNDTATTNIVVTDLNVTILEV